MKSVTVFSMTTLQSLLLTAVALVSVGSQGGTGAGNEFKHLINQEFDFHVGMPDDWVCNDCMQVEASGAGSESEILWNMGAPEGSTWLKARFISGFPATTEAELHDEISRRHQGTVWHSIQRADGAFIGYSNSPLGDAANAALEYYLVKSNMVVSIEWLKNPAFPERALQLDLIKASIDRVSAPIKIKGIKTETGGVVRPGDTVCWQIEVDDLRSGFSGDSIRSFDIKGAVKHFSFKSIQWIADKNWFRICQKVSSVSGEDGLTVDQVSITDGFREVSCRIPDYKAKITTDKNKTSDLLSCSGFVDSGHAPPPYFISQRVAKVAVATRNEMGPIVSNISFDAVSKKLLIDAQDENGLYMASIHTAKGSILVYPDQLLNRSEVDLSQLSFPGWNHVVRIIIYDREGLATILDAPQSLDSSLKTRVFYEVRDWNGQRNLSNIPVVAWLQARRISQ